MSKSVSSLAAPLMVIIGLYVVSTLYNYGNQWLSPFKSTHEDENDMERTLYKIARLKLTPKTIIQATAPPACTEPTRHEDCEVIHIAVLSVKTQGARQVALLVKSLLIQRTTRIHFHFLVDDISYVILHELFRTWNILGVHRSFYNLTKLTSDAEDHVHQKTHNVEHESLAVLKLPSIMSLDVHQVIVLNSNRMVNSDPRSLWCHFETFKAGQSIGTVITDGKVKLGVMLLNLFSLRQQDWLATCDDAKKTLMKSSAPQRATQLQAVMDEVLRRRGDLFFRLPCEWNYEFIDSETECIATKGIKIMDYSTDGLPQHNWKSYLWAADYNGNLLRDTLPGFWKSNLVPVVNESQSPHLIRLVDEYKNQVCSDYAREFIETFRTHLFYVDFEYVSDAHGVDGLEVTLVTQVSISRISSLEHLCAIWPGPVSVAVYLKDSDARHFGSYVLQSKVFSKRRNIAFHLVYQDGSQYPTNHLRNVATQHLLTSHAFLLDVDFMPVADAYIRIKDAVQRSGNYPEKTAFLVPAFETAESQVDVPKSREEMVALSDKGTFFQFRLRVYKEGHRATDYARWRNATEPYQVNWEYGYEPYVIVPARDIPLYNGRFMGYGGDKVSHIMEIAAKGYSFVVLPDVFIVHLPHGVSFDSIRFRSSMDMINCMKVLLEDFGKELLTKYGTDSLRGWAPSLRPPISVRL